ncbi:hypothetical protein Leryth_015170 [Lithospermum erythrorhizon]|nr:hypothetical protein Leryth_015170 [Lithospermum erythrorhizon]
MKKSLHQLMLQKNSVGNGTDDSSQIHKQGVVTPTEGFEKKEHSWIATFQIPTDISILVQDVTFHVHKYPLVSRCGYLGRPEFQVPNSSAGVDIKLDSFPGGSDTFEIILKYCYGLPVSLTPDNIAAVRCGSEFLEMTEDLEDGNLISKAEAFFTFVILSSWRDTITVLKTCETLSPWAENVQIVRRCCDSIALKLTRENFTTGQLTCESWWFDDVTTLRMDHFMRITSAVRAKGMKPETIGSCIMQYGAKWLPTLEFEMAGSGSYTKGKSELQWDITSGRKQEVSTGQDKELRMIIENLLSILPPQKEAVPCKFLLKMLKMAVMYSASPALVSELEKRIGMVLENASVCDLLIPNYTIGDQWRLANSPREETIHNTDVVHRILEYYLMYEHQQCSGTLNISKLLDNYLAEIARDSGLSMIKFQLLAESLPENARTCHDGLYRAIDTYLKAHPSLSEQERRRLCKVMDCEKLSLDACLHAAQNERLPLRTVIQVLFSEQMKIRAAIQGKDHIISVEKSDDENNESSTKEEVKSLKTELEKVKESMAELQRDYRELQQDHEKLNNKHRNLSSWAIGWRKIKRSGMFQRKLDTEETDEGQRRHNSGHKTSHRRRQSIS